MRRLRTAIARPGRGGGVAALPAEVFAAVEVAIARMRGACCHMAAAGDGAFAALNIRGALSRGHCSSLAEVMTAFVASARDSLEAAGFEAARALAKAADAATAAARRQPLLLQLNGLHRSGGSGRPVFVPPAWYNADALARDARDRVARFTDLLKTLRAALVPAYARAGAAGPARWPPLVPPHGRSAPDHAAFLRSWAALEAAAAALTARVELSEPSNPYADLSDDEVDADERRADGAVLLLANACDRYRRLDREALRYALPPAGGGSAGQARDKLIADADNFILWARQATSEAEDGAREAARAALRGLLSRLEFARTREGVVRRLEAVWSRAPSSGGGGGGAASASAAAAAASGGGDDDLQCAICLDLPAGATQVVLTPCGHLFCHACLRGYAASRAAQRLDAAAGGLVAVPVDDVRIECPSCKARFALREAQAVSESADGASGGEVEALPLDAFLRADGGGSGDALPPGFVPTADARALLLGMGSTRASDSAARGATGGKLAALIARVRLLPPGEKALVATSFARLRTLATAALRGEGVQAIALEGSPLEMGAAVARFQVRGAAAGGGGGAGAQGHPPPLRNSLAVRRGRPRARHFDGDGLRRAHAHGGQPPLRPRPRAREGGGGRRDGLNAL